MRTTKVIELKSLEDVKRFCSTLIRVKSKATKSLKLLVAVTAEQDTIIRDAGIPLDSHPIESAINKLDTRKPKKQPQKKVREAITETPKPRRPKKDAKKPPDRKLQTRSRGRRRARPPSFFYEE